MSRFDFIPLSSPPVVKINFTQRHYDTALNREVDKIWKEETKKNDLLYNGQILNLVHFNESALEFELSEYRYFIAQLNAPELIKKINILPFGVTGITTSGKYFLIGKRSERVSMHPGYYELAPSGSVDATVSMKEQIVKELQEEVGILKQEILSVSPFALVVDWKQHYAEICFKIKLTENCMEKTKFFEDEYSAILWSTHDQLKEHCLKNLDSYVPLSSYLIHSIL